MISTRYNGAFTCSAIAIAVAGVAIATTLPTLLNATFTGAGEGADASETRRALLARHEAALTEDRDRFVGRSAFFTPPKRRPPVKPRVASQPRTTPDPEPVETGPRVETRYTGPAITAIVVDTVWFRDGKRIIIGKEEDGIKVINLEKAPYSARLFYKGWEGEVGLFEQPMLLSQGHSPGGELGGILDSEPEEERAARIAEMNRAAAEDAASAHPQPANGGRDDARRRALSDAQRRRARQSDPKPSVPDE